MSNELKACLHCDNDPAMVRDEESASMNWVACRCGAQTPYFQSQQEAIDFWNNHLASRPVREEREEGNERRSEFMRLILEEVEHAYRKHGSDQWGRHEFRGVLDEEIDELHDAITGDLPQDEVVKEYIQVAAVCLRYHETGDRYREPLTPLSWEQRFAEFRRTLDDGHPNPEGATEAWLEKNPRPPSHPDTERVREKIRQIEIP